METKSQSQFIKCFSTDKQNTFYPSFKICVVQLLKEERKLATTIQNKCYLKHVYSIEVNLFIVEFVLR